MAVLRWKTIVSSNTLQNDALARFKGRPVLVTVDEEADDQGRDFAAFLLGIPAGEPDVFERPAEAPRADVAWDS